MSKLQTMMLINEEDMNTRKKGKGSKGKRNKGKETLIKKSKKEKEDLIEKLDLKGKKTIELKNKGIDIKVSKVADQAIMHGIDLVKDEDFKKQ